MNRWALAVALLASGFLSQPVSAQPVSAQPVSAQPEDWEVMWDRGVALRSAGDDLAALAVFQEARRLGGGPRVLVQIALAEQALGRWGAAGTHLEEAFVEPDAWIQRNRAVITAARAEIAIHTGRMQVAVDVDGAEIEVGGRPVGLSPLSRAVVVTAGSIVVTARAPNGVSVEQTVDVEVGGEERISLRLTPEVTPAEVLEPNRERAELAPEPTAPDLSQPSGGADRVSGFPIAPALVSYGVAGAALVALAVSGPIALDLDAAIGGDCGERVSRTCTESDVADLRAAVTAADASLVVAAAAGAVALVLTVVALVSGEDAADLALAPFAGPDGGGLVVGSAL